MTILWDDGPLDLVMGMDAAQLAYLQHRYEIAEKGFRQQRLRALQRAVNDQLKRTQQETSPHA